MTPRAELVAELDELIRTETVRERHIRLVRIRAGVDRLLGGNADIPPRADGLDNVITSAGADGA